MAQRKIKVGEHSGVGREETTVSDERSAPHREAELRQRARYLTAALVLTFIVALSFGIQARQNRSGELAVQSISVQNTNLPLSMRLGIEAYRTFDTSLARSALLDITEAHLPLIQILEGHTSDVESVAFSPDGKTLASGSFDGTIILWNVATRRAIGQPLRGHTGFIYSVAFSPDGKTLASGSNDGTVRLWDVAARQPIGRLLPADMVFSVAFSPDGKTLASGGNGTLVLWDVATRQPIGQPYTERYGFGSLTFSPDGKTLAYIYGNGDAIILWDVATRQPIDQLQTYEVNSIAFSPDGKTLAAGGDDGTINMWDMATRRPIAHPPTEKIFVRNIAFSPDGNLLASGKDDGTIMLWEKEGFAGFDGAYMGSLAGHTRPVTSMAFSPDGKILASGSMDGTILLSNLSVLSATSESGMKSPIGQLIAWGGKTYKAKDVIDMYFSPASGSAEKEEIWWDALTRQPIGQWIMDKTSKRTVSAALSPDGKTLASGSYDDSIILWNVATRQPIGQPLKGHIGKVSSVAFSPDGKTLASGGLDGTIILWDALTRRPMGQPLAWHTGKVITLAFSPDGETLASGDGDGTVTLWDIAARRAIGRPLTGHTSQITSLAFSPDGKTLASTGNDDTVILWDAATRQMTGQPLSVPPYDWVAGSVAFSPDGKTLAYDNGDGTIVLWDVATRQMMGRPLTFWEPDTAYTNSEGDVIYSSWANRVTRVAFSPDGKTLVSAGNDDIVIHWDLDPQSWIEKTCQRVGRNFTRAEWAQYFPGETYRATCPQWPLEPEPAPASGPTP